MEGVGTGAIMVVYTQAVAQPKEAEEIRERLARMYWRRKSEAERKL